MKDPPRSSANGAEAIVAYERGRLIHLTRVLGILALLVGSAATAYIFFALDRKPIVPTVYSVLLTLLGLYFIWRPTQIADRRIARARQRESKRMKARD